MASALCEFFQPSKLRQNLSVLPKTGYSEAYLIVFRGVDTRCCFPADYELDAQDEKNVGVGVQLHCVLLGLILRYHV